MVASEISGKAQTVLGPVAPENLGVTLPHEHILSDFSISFTEPAEATEKYLAYQPITLETSGWLRMNHDRNLDNVRLLDEEVAIDEVLRYKRSGGLTIVEVTPKNVGRDPSGLQRVARATGINIIMGTAYYVAAAHPPEVEERTEKQIATEFVNEIMIGADKTGVRAGIIGEVGCSWPLNKNEVKVLRAASTAQQKNRSATNDTPWAP